MVAFLKYNLESYKKSEQTETILLKHVRSIEGEFELSEIYKYCKKDIKFFMDFYNKSITFLDLTLYIINEKEKEDIYYLLIDKNKSVLTKEKYYLENNKVIYTKFNIFVLIKKFKLPVNISKKNSLASVLTPTFYHCSGYLREIDNVKIKVFKFKTKTIETGTYTTLNLYEKSLQHIITLQSAYNNDKVDGLLATKTSYSLEFKSEEDSRTLYYVEINKKMEILQRSTPYLNIRNLIKAPFKLSILVSVFHDPRDLTEQELLEENTTRELEILEDRLQKVKLQLERFKESRNLKLNKKCKKEETCCVCLSSPSNILFPDCGHLCICENCNNNITNSTDFNEEDLKCPLCRTVVTLPRITI